MTGSGAADGQQVEKLGYLGLGMMGSPMTRRLVKAGYDVTVWNRSHGKVAGPVDAGARAAAQPRDVAETVSIVFMCLADAAAVDEGGVRSQRPRSGERLRKTRGRLLIDPAGCGSLRGSAAEGN